MDGTTKVALKKSLFINVAKKICDIKNPQNLPNIYESMQDLYRNPAIQYSYYYISITSTI